jgi:hypothetical protein
MSFENNFTEVTATLYRSFIKPVAEFVIEKYKIEVDVNTLVEEIKENLNLPETAVPVNKTLSAGINSFAPSLNMTSSLPVIKNTISNNAPTPSKKTRGVSKPVQIWISVDEFKEQRGKDAKICAYMSNRIKDEDKRGKVCAAVVEDTTEINPLKWRCVSCKGKASDVEKEFEKETKTNKKSISITGVIPPLIDTKTISLPMGTTIPPGMSFSLNVPPIPSIDVKPSTPKAVVPAPKLHSPKIEVASVIPILPQIPMALPEPVKEPEAPVLPPALPEPPMALPEPVKEPEAPVLPPAPKPLTPKPASPVAINPQSYEGFKTGHHYMLEFKSKQYLFGMINGKYYIHGKFTNLPNPAPANYTDLLVKMEDSEIAQFSGVLTYEYLGTEVPSIPSLPVIKLPGIPSIPGL